VGNSAQSRDRFAQELFIPLPDRYDRLVEWLSMGQNRRWRRAAIDRVVEKEPQRILDVATGTAGVALGLAERTNAQIVGVDLTEDMLRVGSERVATANKNDRIRLVVGRAQQLPFPDGVFDALTFTYLLRYVPDPAAALKELARVLKADGVAASLDFFVPPSTFWRFWWWGYTRIVLPAAGLATGGRAWFRVGRFLGPNISRHYRRYPLAWTFDAWHRAGFEEVGAAEMSLGGGLVMWGKRARG
jgi:demethylmenaquinone methyltransferase/2-methoxy-6-polyprenyl-1,4-benzoquinol methylase